MTPPVRMPGRRYLHQQLPRQVRPPGSHLLKKRKNAHSGRAGSRSQRFSQPSEGERCRGGWEKRRGPHRRRARPAGLPPGPARPGPAHARAPWGLGGRARRCLPVLTPGVMSEFRPGCAFRGRDGALPGPARWGGTDQGPPVLLPAASSRRPLPRDPALPRTPQPEPKMATGEPLPSLGIVPDSKMVANGRPAGDILAGQSRRRGPVGWGKPRLSQPASPIGAAEGQARSHWLARCRSRSLRSRARGTIFHSAEGGRGRGGSAGSVCPRAPSGRRWARAGRRRMLRPLGPAGRR